MNYPIVQNSKVADLRGVSMRAMKRLGEYCPKVMPYFFKAVKNLVGRVERFLNNLKTDVQVFFNVSIIFSSYNFINKSYKS